MKRHSSLIPLSHDHHMTLLIAITLHEGAPKYKGMSDDPKDKAAYIKKHFDTHLVKHFETEEKILFPFVKGRDKETDAVIEELINEHRIIAKSIPTIDETTDLPKQLHAIGELLEKHIRKEERVLFERIPQLYSEEELQKLEMMIPKSAF